MLSRDGDLLVGKCLLHTENGGEPHCVAVLREDEAETVTIWDVDCELQVPDTVFRAAVLEGIDASTCVFFQLQAEDAELDRDGPEMELLELSARAAPGLDESDDDAPGDEQEQRAAGRGLERLDEHGQVTVEAELLKDLKDEFASYVEKARRNGIKPEKNGAFRCPACPFRTFDRCGRFTRTWWQHWTWRCKP